MRSSLFVAACVCAAAAGVARADVYSSIDSIQSVQRWYNDYPGTTIGMTSSGLTSLHITETDFVSSTGYTDRNIGFLAIGGAAFAFDPTKGFRVDADVVINSVGFGTEVGFTVGTAPAFPTSTLANTGDFHLRVDDGEIAAFGGFNPFFANNNPFNGGNAHPWPTIVRGTTYRLTMTYSGQDAVFGAHYNFGVNGVMTGELTGAEIGGPFYIGLFAQGPNNGPISPGYSTDVTFSNIALTVPTPASIGLLGLGGLVALRRRR
jgi:hypothetical protein